MGIEERLRVEIEKLTNTISGLEEDVTRLQALIPQEDMFLKRSKLRIISDMQEEIKVLRLQSANWQEKYESSRRALYACRKGK